jgi:hypothetical protein
MTRHERIYRRLLRVYPDDFRAQYGAEMTRLFGDQLRDAQSSGRPTAIASLWLRSIGDLVASAPQHHLEKERLVPQPVDVSTGTTLVPERRHPDRLRRVLLGLLPLWIVILRLIANPGSMDPLFEKPPEAFGLPAGIVWLGGAFAVMALGVAVLWRTTSNGAAFVVLTFLTMPAAAATVLAPAIVLVMQNLRA